MFQVEFDKNAFDKAIVDAIAEQIKKKVIRAVGSSNAGKIKVRLKGRDLQKLSVDVTGPEELIEKVRQALQ